MPPGRFPLMRAPLSFLVLVCALALGALAPAAASAATGPCFPGAQGAPCRFWTATVTDINDGDTVSVRLDGDRSGRIWEIRFRAVQAMELSRYSHLASRRRGACHAVAAANRVEQLIRASHNRVRLSAQHPATDVRGRLIRWIAVRRAGRWQDLGEILMREGHTLFMDNTSDTAWNRRYDLLGQQAARRGRNLWNPTTCGAGPQQRVPIRVWVLSDPVGMDTPDGEWVKVQNRSASETLHLGRWWIRDAMLRRYTFPAHTAVAPGATVTLHVGHGRNHGADLFWGLGTTVFENAGDARELGDGAYLFDPRGDLRAWMLYPCLVACADPAQGALQVTAEPRNPERIVVRNVSSAPIDLTQYEVAVQGSDWPFRDGTTLEPGQTLTVALAGDPRDDTRTTQHLGLHRYLMPDASGWAAVRTFTDIDVACDAWGGNRHCGG